MAQPTVTRTPAQVYDIWIDALLSGQYTQAQQALRKTGSQGGFCCLGVVCDLAAKDGGEKWKGNKYSGQPGHLPLHIREFLGLTIKQQGKLIGLNDRYGYTFAQIAGEVKKLKKQTAYNAARRAKRAAAKLAGVVA